MIRTADTVRTSVSVVWIIFIAAMVGSIQGMQNVLNGADTDVVNFSYY